MSKSDKESELKPCPFCGGEPEIRQTGRLKMRIRCKSCLMGIENRVLKFSLEWLEGKLIEAWNRRLEK